MLEVLRRQFAWTDWANHSTFAALRRAHPAPPQAARRLAHLAATEHLWLARLERRPQPMPVWPELDLEATGAYLDELPELWRRYFDRAGESGLTGNVAYTNSKGESFTNRAGDILLHVVSHGAYHRGQISADLRAGGFDPVLTDFIHWVRTVDAAPARP